MWKLKSADLNLVDGLSVMDERSHLVLGIASAIKMKLKLTIERAISQSVIVFVATLCTSQNAWF